jgi:hypothetical protein
VTLKVSPNSLVKPYLTFLLVNLTYLT